VLPDPTVIPAEATDAQAVEDSDGETVLLIVTIVLMVAVVALFAGLVYIERQRRNRTLENRSKAKADARSKGSAGRQAARY
jgi:preprotein translocase subunit SecY